MCFFSKVSPTRPWLQSELSSEKASERPPFEAVGHRGDTPNVSHVKHNAEKWWKSINLSRWDPDFLSTEAELFLFKKNKAKHKTLDDPTVVAVYFTNVFCRFQGAISANCFKKLSRFDSVLNLFWYAKVPFFSIQFNSIQKKSICE